MSQPLPAHDGWALSAEQIDGTHCVSCDQAAEVMRPAYSGPRGQLFRCEDCEAMPLNSAARQAEHRRRPDSDDPRSTELLSPARREVRRELHEQRMVELQQLAKKIGDLELWLGVARGELDSRLYYLHEDGVPIAELARNARRSRETVYASIDRYRAENHAPGPPAVS